MSAGCHGHGFAWPCPRKAVGMAPMRIRALRSEDFASRPTGSARRERCAFLRHNLAQGDLDDILLPAVTLAAHGHSLPFSNVFHVVYVTEDCFHENFAAIALEADALTFVGKDFRD